MNKNFEEEYIQMIESDIPDLWDRIEAQLPANAPKTDKPAGRLLHFTRKHAAYLVSAAAAVCLLILLPALFLQSPNSGPSSEDSLSNSNHFAGIGPASDGASNSVQNNASNNAPSYVPDQAPNQAPDNNACAEEVPREPQNTINVVNRQTELLILAEHNDAEHGLWYEAKQPSDGTIVFLRYATPEEADDFECVSETPLTVGQTYFLLLYPIEERDVPVDAYLILDFFEILP